MPCAVTMVHQDGLGKEALHGLNFAIGQYRWQITGKQLTVCGI